MKIRLVYKIQKAQIAFEDNMGKLYRPNGHKTKTYND